MRKEINSHLRTEGDINFSEARKNWAERNNDPATTAMLEADSRYFLHQSLSTPCLDVLKSCEGIYITNLQDKSYIDFHGNNVHHLGYRNKYILDRVKAQMDELPFSPRRFTNPVAIELAERLASLTNGVLSRVLLAPGGTSAIGIALKLARVVTGKYKTISMWDAFHGASMDSITVGGEYMFQKDIGPLIPGNIHVPPPDNYRGMWTNPDAEDSDIAYANYIEYVIEKEGDIGAVVAETIRSTDVKVPSKAYWKRVREICDKHGVLLILDEIPICLGRTGAVFTYQQYDIEPDILVIGKGLGAGVIPMAAMMCREEYNVAGHISLGHYTHEKSPLGAAAALAALDYMEEFKVLQHVNKMEAYMCERLQNMYDRHSIIGQVRGMGMLWGVELVTDRKSKAKDIASAEKIMYRCMENGLSFKVSAGNVLSLYPPLITEQNQLAAALDIVEEAIMYTTK
ncbi:(R)-1-hydroxy-2-aminoethylphosphonate ammonia-lyase [Flavihumibacter profundi]|uniref:(R)-1-hydroxy-2-aminoethylphosphonate ammonia-lyase n=1 Tax=Flavihumibacter profundi TaxID=2716883 RepID=UPI001CC38001|nr:aspartate aminotransferase family protein [Flavihumibacter profundi]MBZ5857459.1 aspartate aminotransferase family protein [Flavihumibacter profundi]